MKYRTFVQLRTVAVALVILGGAAVLFFGCRSSAPAPLEQSAAVPETMPAPQNAPQVQSTLPPVAPPTQPDNRESAAPVGPSGNRNFLLTDVEKEILTLQGEPLTNGTSDGKTRKWVVKTSRFKAEFRSDTDKGSTTWNRVKIDYNNNKKFEERWDFKNGGVKRRVAPNDDENYGKEFRLQGETWVQK